VLALAPLLSLIGLALQGDAEVWPHLAAYVIPHALTQTVLLLAGVAVLTSLGGVGTAWLMTAYAFPGRRPLTWLLPLPLAVPTYLVAYVYVDLMEAMGPVQAGLRAMFGFGSPQDYWFPSIRSLGGAIFLFSIVLYPYVYLAARAAFQLQSGLYLETARVLGGRGWPLFRDITLPLARPAIMVGMMLALLETLNDIGAAEYLGIQTLTLSIMTTWLNRGSLPGAAQISCIMLMVVVGLIGIEQFARRQRAVTSHAQKPLPPRRRRLPPVQGSLAALACTMPAALGFLVPGGYLLAEAVRRTRMTGIDPALADHAAATLTFAAGATGLTLLLGFGAVAGGRLLRARSLEISARIASLGYAVPGTVLALGLLTPLMLVDGALNRVSQAVAGIEVGLVVAGSGAAVVAAYVVRFMAIATGFAQAGFGRISREFDESARIAGAAPWTVIRTVHLPLLRPALGGAALLVFVDCLKELPATLMLRPLNVETLSTYIYQFAVRGNFEEGAVAALLIVAVGILPVIRIARHADLAMDAARRAS